ncbi:pyroglutamyl-peptidase I [Streptomyces thermodiastaticus]|uniref:pyroglutamyl-peptidase I n=1 Tax=Streptomyces thermodiastaticus TaxID=44061 RepID=UPI00167B8D40|nr:pyroglutamyl-peptidase I [Streptomyces thermodiastaticus]MCE7551065.1 pyroglutamyl-peptidase I [Streptomyces thermodiastaticus]GHF58366.1 pyrrolidone-carboxylate peptidase [Streptomyces thermodiastaticus]
MTDTTPTAPAPQNTASGTPGGTVKVLVTGFEPFGGESINPSWQAAEQLAAQPPAGLDVTAVRLSCVFGTALEELRAAVDAAGEDLALVVSLGQAGGRPDLTVERVAINVDDARIPDNAGRQPVDEPVVPGGPAAYFSTLPMKACVAAARAAGVPASVSQTAGTFVCNHVFYGLAHLLATERPGIRGGFVHVPYSPEQAAALSPVPPSLSVPDAVRGLSAILATAARTTTDIRVTGGATH